MCPRAYSARIERHNKVLDSIITALSKVKGTASIKEPIIPMPRGAHTATLKPDIITFQGKSIFVLDPNVVADGFHPEERFQRKVVKYSCPPVEMYARDAFKALTDQTADHFQVIGIILSWRGSWDPRSWSALRRLGISEYTLNMITVRMLCDTWHICRFGTFMNNPTTEW